MRISMCIAAVLCLFLLACGHDGGDGALPVVPAPGKFDRAVMDTAGVDAPAHLDTVEDGVRAIRALNDLWTAHILIADKAASDYDFAYQCHEGGSGTFTPDDVTADPHDGVAEFANCLHVAYSVEGEEYLRWLTDGVIREECLEFDAASNRCTHDRSDAGDADRPFLQRTISSESDLRVQGAITSDNTYGHTDAGDTGVATMSGAVQHDNPRNGHSGTVVFDHFTTSHVAGLQDRYDGAFGVSDRARTTANCIAGRVTVSTGDDGAIHFASADGTYADVVRDQHYNLTVSVNGGPSQTFGPFEAANFCQVD